MLFRSDRDYATWFEFGWDVEGGLRDRCNDMIGWNPEWYIAFHPTETSWNTEIAIPIATLVNSSATAPAVPWEKLPWGVSIVRECPTRSTEFLVSGDRDRWSKDQWLIMDLRPPATPIAEPDRLPSMDAEKP